MKFKNSKHRRAQLTGYTRKWRAKQGPKKIREMRRGVYLRRKIRAIRMVGPELCNRYLCTEIDFLEFNHRGGGGCKDWRENYGAAIADRLLAGKIDPKTFEILCRVCNALDYLERVNPEAAKAYRIKWEKHTDQKAIKVSSGG